MNIYTPYTYLIGWSEQDKWYYGVRYAKNCNPDELWVKYFTSSNYVKEFRKQYGEPDITQVRKVFDNQNSALLWEEKVLRKINANNNDKFLNANVAGAISSDASSKAKKKYWDNLSQEQRSAAVLATRNKISTEVRRKSASVAGKASTEKRTAEQKLEFGRRAAKARNQSMTAEQKRACGIKGMESRWSAMTSEERSLYTSKRMEKVPLETCIHCGRTLRKNQITRFHNDNCKSKT